LIFALLIFVGGFVCFANAMAMEGASKDLCFAGYLGVLAGAIIAVGGSVMAAECGYGYNGRTGRSNLVPVIFMVALLLISIIAIVVGVLYMLGAVAQP